MALSAANTWNQFLSTAVYAAVKSPEPDALVQESQDANTVVQYFNESRVVDNRDGHLGPRKVKDYSGGGPDFGQASKVLKYFQKKVR